MTGNCEQEAEEESSASEGKRETVGKPTGKTPDMQNVQDVAETVTKKERWKKFHQVHGNKSRDTCHQRDMR